MNLTLIRTTQIPTEPQVGMLLIEGKPKYLTLELPWLDNKPKISCIPTGEYICKKTISQKAGRTYEVTNVPGRSGILFHAGNEPKDTEGCILLGERLVLPDFISGSRNAVEKFLEEVTVAQFNLKIIGHGDA